MVEDRRHDPRIVERQSRHAFALLSASNGYGYHTRIDPGGFTNNISGVTGAAPGWVRLVRTGSQIEAFRSTNGTTWTSMGVDVVPMAATVYVGIATTSHKSTVATKAVLTNLKLTAAAPAPPANQPPTVVVDRSREWRDLLGAGVDPVDGVRVRRGRDRVQGGVLFRRDSARH